MELFSSTIFNFDQSVGGTQNIDFNLYSTWSDASKDTNGAAWTDCSGFYDVDTTNLYGMPGTCGDPQEVVGNYAVTSAISTGCDAPIGKGLVWIRSSALETDTSYKTDHVKASIQQQLSGLSLGFKYRVTYDAIARKV